MRARRPVRLFSVGSIVADVRIDVPHLPSRGGDVLASVATISAGGGFNILAAAARNRLPSLFGGRHGVGPYGDRIRADLARENIATLFPPTSAGDSGFCIAMVEPDGERTFVTSPGVEAQVETRALDELDIEPTDAVFVSGYDLSYPLLCEEIARWIGRWSADALLIVDPGPLVAEIPTDIFDAVLARARVLTLNRREAALFARTDDALRVAALALPRLSDGALLIFRDGPEGCLLFGAELPDAPVHLGAPSVRALDSTGAGDAHTGVFVAGLAAGLDPIAAATRANAAAALSVTRRGPATAPTTMELDAFMATWP
jgi:sugar/nucleoside kinase (ribokinase family)